MNGVRRSPLEDRIAALNPRWGQRHGMRVALQVTGNDGAMLETVALADFSHRPKAGVKGPGAAQWLKAQGVPVPDGANTWAALPDGGVVARLGRSEFFLEGGRTGSLVGAIARAPQTGTAGVYPVIRQDAGIALAGRRANELLVQTCNVNFEEAGLRNGVAVMAQMIGVGVLAIRNDTAGTPHYRIWCDPTFAPYFWETLAQIAGELGGGVVGTDVLAG